MATTVLDCLVRAGKITDDSVREIDTEFVAWVEVEPGAEGFDVFIF